MPLGKDMGNGGDLDELCLCADDDVSDRRHLKLIFRVLAWVGCFEPMFARIFSVVGIRILAQFPIHKLSDLLRYQTDQEYSRRGRQQEDRC
jgi:hypothetical protein